ncbi:MAG: hypothetical protein WD960_05690 [Gemmatimonadota bacterium]
MGLCLGVLLALLIPATATAQLPIGEAEALYRQALEAYEEVFEAHQEARQIHEILLDRQIEAQRSGDEEQIIEALARVHYQGWEIVRLDRQLQAAAEELRAGASELRRTLNAREQRLLDQFERVALPGERDRILREIANLRIRYLEVEEQVGSELVTEARMLPELAVAPRDGPQELLAKASLMENFARQYDALLVSIDREITTRERQLQQERGREDFMAGISRFGDDELVGGSGALPRPQVTGTGAGDVPIEFPDLEELTLEEHVAWLRGYRDLIAGWRDEALGQAQRFQQLAGGGGGNR